MTFVAASPYMQWAKTRSGSKYNLAVSGMENYSLRDLDVSIDDLEINGPSIYGYEPLQNALARRYQTDPDCVVAAIGTSLANHLAMAAILRPGDEVLIEQPVYELLLSTAYYLGAIVKRFSRRFEDGFQINTSEIKDLITPKTKLIIMTNLHNPSSVLTNESTLKEIAEITQGKCYVLVDEVYLETMFEQTPKSAFHLGENFISTNSLTKTYGLSGLRCGWILANKELAEKIWLLNDLFGVAAPHPAERLSVIALAELDKVGQRTKNLLTTNRKIINEFLDNQPKLSCVKVDFGTVVFPRLLKGNVSDLCQVLREKYETTVVPGDFFEMPNHFRLGICMNTSILIEGLERLSQALTEI